MSDIVAIVGRFARALDDEDYETAQQMIGHDCEYVSPKGTLVGPQAIAASYRHAGEWARANLDRVKYESHVRIDGVLAVITFIDHLTHAGQSQTYSCEQVLSLDSGGTIRRIEHRELPGQREAADRFLEQVGISR